MSSPFLSLPAELQLHIYSHLYPTKPHSQTSPSPTVNLLEADPPTKSPCLTSKQLHRETHVLYKSSYRAYWTRTAFTLDATAFSDNGTAARKALVALNDEDLNQIAILTIHDLPPAHTISSTFTLIDNRGGWRLQTVSRTTNTTSRGTPTSPPSSSSADTSVGEETETTTTTFRRYRVWTTRISPEHPSTVHPTKLAWDGYKDEEELRRACESFSASGRNRVGVRHQIFDLVGWESREG